MDEELLYSISWTDFVTEEPRRLQIWGNVDNTDNQVYYTCLVIKVDGQWIDNGGKDTPLAVNLGRLLESCNFLVEIDNPHD